MSHIAQENRHVLEANLTGLINNLRELECDVDNNDMEANVAYIFGRVLKAVYPGNRYSELNAAVGALEMAKLEYYRNQGTTLSKQQEFENGSL